MTPRDAIALIEPENGSDNSYAFDNDNMVDDVSRVHEMRAEVAVLQAETAHLRDDVSSLGRMMASNHSDNRVEIRNIQIAIGEAIRLLKSEQIADLVRRMEKLEDNFDDIRTRQDATDVRFGQWAGREQAMGWFAKSLWALGGAVLSGIAIWAKWLIAGAQHGN